MNIFFANISHSFAKKLKATLLTLLLLLSASLLSAHAQSNEITTLRAKAESGDPQAQFSYGFYHQCGWEGLPKNSNEAIKWYRKAADQGHGKAAFAIGVLYRRGEGVERNIPLAMYWYKKAFENGDSDGIDAYNELYNMGYRAATSPYGKSPDTTPIPEIVDSSPANNSGSSITNPKEQFYKGVEYDKSKNYIEAAKWYRKAAEQGLAEAQYNLGICYENGMGVTRDYTEAAKWYRKAAEQGYAQAQFNLGVCYANGQGVTQNYTEAVKWYRKAAEQGIAEAQYNLGLCYYNGQGATQNHTEATKWYRKAAEQGLAPAQYNLGVCYENGKGVTQNYTEATKWYRKAAEQGDAMAQYNLGICYNTGQGVTQNYTEAAKWFRKAAEQGDAMAQCNLGVCYYSGEGVTQNIPVAMYWLKKAADNGNKNALEAYSKLYDLGYRAATSPNDGTGSSNNSTGKSTAKTEKPAEPKPKTDQKDPALLKLLEGPLGYAPADPSTAGLQQWRDALKKSGKEFEESMRYGDISFFIPNKTASVIGYPARCSLKLNIENYKYDYYITDKNRTQAFEIFDQLVQTLKASDVNFDDKEKPSDKFPRWIYGKWGNRKVRVCVYDAGKVDYWVELEVTGDRNYSPSDYKITLTPTASPGANLFGISGLRITAPIEEIEEQFKLTLGPGKIDYGRISIQSSSAKRTILIPLQGVEKSCGLISSDLYVYDKINYRNNCRISYALMDIWFDEKSKQSYISLKDQDKILDKLYDTLISELRADKKSFFRKGSAKELEYLGFDINAKKVWFVYNGDYRDYYVLGKDKHKKNIYIISVWDRSRK